MTTATLSSAGIVARPRWYRSLAVLGGLIVNAALSSATDLLLVAAGVFPHLSRSQPAPTQCHQCTAGNGGRRHCA
jgi:hypothetical protein